MGEKTISAIIVGAGNRAIIYSKYALENPEELKIVGVVDPQEIRRKRAKDLFNLSDNQCYLSIDELIKEEKKADAIINGTMDHLHVKTSIPLLKKGYDMLLEKPFAINKQEVNDLVEVAKKYNRKVMICHVLRYAPFYSSIKQRLINNEIGDIINIQTTEHVNFHHYAVSYVRGKWRSKKLCHASMLLAKSCHDIDIIMWMLSGTKPLHVSSSGSNMNFIPEKMPKDAGTRCMVDCPIEEECNYSCRKHYIEHPTLWKQYVWTGLENIKEPTLEDKINSLKTDNHYGKCVWRYDNDVVDHQSVMITFENGCTSTHNMIAGTPLSERNIHIIGTKGEIKGTFEDSKFIVRKIAQTKERDYIEEVVELEIIGDMVGAQGGHGGGEELLVEDFVKYMRGEKCSVSLTSIEDSVNSHITVFCADEAMENNCVVPIRY